MSFICVLLALFAPTKQEVSELSLLQRPNATSISAIQLEEEDEELAELPECTTTDLLMHEDQRAMGTSSPDDPEIPDDPPCRVTPDALRGLEAFHNAPDGNAEDLSLADAQDAAPEENTSAPSSMSQLQTNATGPYFLHFSVYKVHKKWCKPPCHGPSWENAATKPEKGSKNYALLEACIWEAEDRVALYEFDEEWHKKTKKHTF